MNETSTGNADNFNAMPYKYRIIASATLIETQIRQIRMDQERAKSAHRKFMRETSDHITNLERSLRERLEEIERFGDSSGSTGA
jgi:hypothetical protein